MELIYNGINNLQNHLQNPIQQQEKEVLSAACDD